MPGVCLARLPGLVTDPLLTASALQFDPPGRLAPHPGRLGVCAERHTTDGAVYTQTAVLTAGLEALTVAVDHSVVLAACAHHVCLIDHVKY